MIDVEQMFLNRSVMQHRLSHRLMRLGLFLLVAVVFTFSGLLATPAYAQNAAAHQQFVFAYRLLQREEYKLSAQAFDEYLARFPEDQKKGDALYYRALLCRNTGKNTLAITYLEQNVAPMHVPDHAVLFLKGQLYSDLGKPQQAVQALESIDMQSLDTDTKASIFYLRGKGYRGLKNLPAAATQLKEVIKIDSSLKAQAMLDLARIQVLMKLPADALATLKKCLTLNSPKVSAEAGRLAGDLAFELKMYDMASKYYDVVMTKYTASQHLGPAITGSLWSLYEQKLYGQVLNSFTQFKKHLSNKDRVTGWYLAGSSYQAMGDHNKAVALFGAILAAAAGSELEDKVLYRLAASQFEIGQFGGMTQTITKLRKSFPNSPRLADSAFLLATAALKQGDNNLAAARLSAIIDSGQRHPFYTQALLQRARLYETIKQYEHAVADYETYAAVYPAAENQVKLGQKTIAQAMIRLVDLNYQVKRFEAADQAAAKLLEIDGLDPIIESEGYYRRGLAQVQMKQFEAASKTLTALLDKYPQNHYRADAIYYRGLLGLSLKQPVKAMEDLLAAAQEKMLSKPLKVNALRLSSLLQRQLKQTDQAATTLANLEELVGLTGLNIKELIWLGSYRMNANQPVEAMRYLKPILDGNVRASRSQLSRALILGARSLRAQNQLPQAIETFREVVAMSQGHGYEARIELARTLSLANQYEEALAEYISLITAQETQIACEALYDSGELHRKLVQIRLRESDAAGAEHQREEAVKSFKRLVLLFTFPEVTPLPELGNIHLAELALEMEKPDQAKATFDEIVASFPDTVYATYATACLTMMQNRKIAATSLFKKIREVEHVDERLLQRIGNHLKVLGGAQ